jgi:hypothetical protein
VTYRVLVLTRQRKWIDFPAKTIDEAKTIVSSAVDVLPAAIIVPEEPAAPVEAPKEPAPPAAPAAAPTP